MNRCISELTCRNSFQMLISRLLSSKVFSNWVLKTILELNERRCFGTGFSHSEDEIKNGTYRIIKMAMRYCWNNKQIELETASFVSLCGPRVIDFFFIHLSPISPQKSVYKWGGLAAASSN